jgi:hypothetical protein
MVENPDVFDFVERRGQGEDRYVTIAAGQPVLDLVTIYYSLRSYWDCLYYQKINIFIYSSREYIFKGSR